METVVDIKKEARDFVSKFNINSIDKLKELREFNEIESLELKNKVYQRAYYLQNKNSKPNLVVKEELFHRNDLPQNYPYKQKILNTSLIYNAVIFFTLIFLMNESRLFYITFGFNSFNALLLPILVEITILLLAVSNDLKSKTLMYLLIIYNIVSFSFYTVSELDYKSLMLEKNKMVATEFSKEKEALLKEQSSVLSSLRKNQKIFDRAISNNLITKANKEYRPHIQKLEARGADISSRLGKLNEKLGLSKVSSSYKVLLVGAISLIALKIILQLSILLFMKKSPFKFSSFQK